ncbi:MAG TPA: flagellar export protein FliJ [Spirochaetia bacterium]|nr:flagellar export protein FliJ [Spirochaetia bacterium]
MKAFVFKLQKLLEKRKAEEDKVKNDMSKYVQDYNRVIGNIEKFRKTLASFNEQKISLLKSQTGTGMYTAGTGFYRQGIKNLENERQGKEAVLNEWRLKLLETVKKRKAIEYLKKNAYENYRKEKRRDEEKFLDDLASRKYNVKMMF